MSTELLSPPEAGTVLSNSPNSELRLIRIQVTEETIVLRGRVSSYYAKQLAQESLRSSAEGRRIVNLLEVRR